MPMAKPTPVRFTDRTDDRLDALSARNGLSKAELIRMAVDRFLDQIESTGSVDFTVTIRGSGAQQANVSGSHNRVVQKTGGARSRASGKKKGTVDTAT